MYHLQIEDFKDAVVEAVKNVANEKVCKIYLYGSYARGDYDAESDIDIMVVLECSKEQLQNYRSRMCRYASKLSLEYDVEVSILMRDNETFSKNKEIVPFYQNILKEGIELYG